MNANQRMSELQQEFGIMRQFRLGVLTSCILASVHGYALETLSDENLSAVNGQSGVSITAVNSGITMDSLYWEDAAGQPSGVEQTKRMTYGTVSLNSNQAGVSYHTTKAEINAGDTAGKPSLDLKLTTSPFTFSADSMKICDATGATCGSSAGGWAVQTTSPITVQMTTTNGLFNQNGTLHLVAPLTGINTYYTQKGLSGPETGQRNQFILNNFRLSIDATGKIWVDPTEGLRIHADTTSLIAGNQTNGAEREGGFNLPMMYKSNAGAGYSTTGAKSFIRLGASGTVVNTDITLRGIDEKTSSTTPILGYATSATGVAGTGIDARIMGSKGIAARLRTEFTKGLATAPGAVTFELGQPGDGGYGLQFQDLTVLDQSSTNNPYLDTGNIYLNTATTRDITNPTNAILLPYDAATNPTGLGILTAPDFTQQIHANATNPDSLIVAMRGGEFQALARRSVFIANGGITGTDLPATGVQTWGLALPIYNLNANFALYGTTTPATLATSSSAISASSYERLGFALSLGTQGRDATGSKTTSILLIDSSGSGTNSYKYVGFRNIDMLLTARGSIGLENGALNLNMPDLLIAAYGEFAAGYLPGSKDGAGVTVASNNFSLPNDIIFGLALKLRGAMDLQVIPGTTSLGNNFMTFAGTYNLTSGSIQIKEPIDGTRIGLDTMSGRINFSNQIKVQKDNVQFNYGLTINPNQVATDVLRIGDVNMYPQGGAAQRLGAMALTGGALTANLKITPR